MEEFCLLFREVRLSPYSYPQSYCFLQKITYTAFLRNYVRAEIFCTDRDAAHIVNKASIEDNKNNTKHEGLTRGKEKGYIRSLDQLEGLFSHWIWI